MLCKFSYAPLDLFFMHEQSRELKDSIKLKILSDEKKISNCVLCIKNYRYERFFMPPEDSDETKGERKS